jgi:hypothetical protein
LVVDDMDFLIVFFSIPHGLNNQPVLPLEHMLIRASKYFCEKRKEKIWLGLNILLVRERNSSILVNF